MTSNAGQRLVWSLLLLLIFYVVGVLVFSKLERKAELDRYAANNELYEKMKELYSFAYCEDKAFESLSFCRNQAAFSESLREYFNEHRNSLEDQKQWTILGSIFYLTHLSTTVGYGSSHPQTPAGQLATIFFALVGIPVMGYTLAQVARLELQGVVAFLGGCFDVKMSGTRRQMIVLWCLLMLFMFGGAFVYTQLETWSYRESLYFCFVTLSTVGFGDYLPSSAVSKVFTIFYMLFGLGVCMLIIAVLTGIVAESHERVHTWVSNRDLEDSMPGCCMARDHAEEAEEAQ